jgi:hypothetical protein
MLAHIHGLVAVIAMAAPGTAQQRFEARACELRQQMRVATGQVVAVERHLGWSRLVVVTDQGLISADLVNDIRVRTPSGVALGPPNILLPYQRVTLDYFPTNPVQVNQIYLE